MFVPRPDARLHVQSFGRGPRTLLAIGGWCAGGEVWHETFEHLPDWRCVALDHRGSGASTQARGTITIDRMADDLVATMDALAIERCVLGAESSGAAVVLEAALRAPGRVDGLVLCGGSWRRPPRAAVDGFAQALERDHAGTLRAFADACVPEAGGDDHRRWGLRILVRSGVEDAVALLRSRLEVDLDDRVAALHVPVLLVHGRRDTIVPCSESDELARRLPDAELHLLEGIGHVPIMTAAAVVAGLVRRRFGAATPPAA